MRGWAFSLGGPLVGPAGGPEHPTSTDTTGSLSRVCPHPADCEPRPRKCQYLEARTSNVNQRKQNASDLQLQPAVPDRLFTPAEARNLCELFATAWLNPKLSCAQAQPSSNEFDAKVFIPPPHSHRPCSGPARPPRPVTGRRWRPPFCAGRLGPRTEGSRSPPPEAACGDASWSRGDRSVRQKKSHAPPSSFSCSDHDENQNHTEIRK